MNNSSNSIEIDNSLLSATSSQIRNLNLFWAGFGIYTLVNCVTITGHLQNVIIYEAAQLLGLVLMLPSAIMLIRFKFDNYYLQTIYILYLFWLLYLLAKGIHFNSDFIKEFFLQGPYRGPIYFAPLILLFPRNFQFYKKLFYVITLIGIISLVFDLVFIKTLLNSDRSSTVSQATEELFAHLSIATGFLVLTYVYFKRKKQFLHLAILGIGLLFAIYRARRGLIFIYSSIFFFSYLFYIFSSRMKLLIIYLSIFGGLLMAVYVSGIYKPLQNHLFGFLVSRGDEDTRELVEDYFHSDMKENDWIFGRGIQGEYFCPNCEEGSTTNYRDTIETGYEQTILNSGLIGLGLFVLIAVPAMLKGIFDSRNILSKAAGLWIFMSLVNSYPATENAFTLQYLVVWVSIGICYSKVIRRMPDNQLQEIFLEEK